MENSLLDWLASHHPTAKRETLRQMIRDRRVMVNGSPARTAKEVISPDDKVEVRDKARNAKASGTDKNLPFRIVHEDADLLIVDKPPGLLTSTVPGERRPTLFAAVQAYVRGREPRAQVGLIHRLDRDASGLLVFSKNDRVYRSLKTQFFHHTVERVYLAVTDGIPTPREGRIASRLEERADGTVYSIRREGKGESAVTRYEVVESRQGRAMVRVSLETGRKHQIRVHLAERGTPIVGDQVYGKGSDAPRLMLVAMKLRFTHPVTDKPVVFELENPKAFKLPA